MNKIDQQYQDLLKSIIDYGIEKSDRTGTGTKSIFGYTIRHNMRDGFPLLTTKKMAWKTMVTELLWFLQGNTNIKYLVDNGCHIWDGDAFKNFLQKSEGDPDLIWNKEQFINLIKNDEKFAKEWGELGPIYGKQWRKWQGWMDLNDGDRRGSIWYDQIQRLIHELKTNPDSRRLLVSSWNVAELDDMILPPCHYSFQVYTRELSYEERYKIWLENNYETGFEPDLKNKINFDDEYWMPTPTRAISLMWNQRSVDTFLGLPFNISSYALLLMLLGKEVNMIPDQLVGNLGDTHLYLDHLDQAKEQLSREPYELPTVNLNFDFTYIDGYKIDWEKIDISKIELRNYKSHPSIKAPLSN